jgi:hypothetical protein
MSGFESRAKPLLLPLLRGEEVTLDSAQQTLIASWATLFALTFELTRKAGDLYHTRQERGWFRQTHLPPRITQIWIGGYVGGEPGLGWSQSLYFALDSNPEQLSKAYCTTFTIGHLALQVLSHRWTKQAAGADRVTARTKHGPWGPTEIWIWPVQSNSVLWPPEQVFDDAGVEEWFERWVSLPPRDDLP